MADFSLNDMPWLTQSADPVRSLSAGAQIGSSIAASRNQRQALAQRRHEFERAQETAQRDQMLQERLNPLKEQAMRMANDLNRLKLDELGKELLMQEKNAKAADEFSSLVMGSVLSGRAATPDVAARVQEIFKTNPDIRKLPDVQKWLERYSESVKIGALSDYRNENLSLRERGASLRELELDLKKRGFGVRQVDQMLRAAELGYEIGDDGAGAALQTPEIGPPAPAQPALKPVARPPTSGTTTQLQKDALTADQALSALDLAVEKIKANPDAIGVRGIVGSGVERLKGQMSPAAPLDTPITDTRQQASIAFSRVAKSLRVDSGNMSRYELNKLEQAGDVLDWSEAPQTALKKLENLQAAVIGQKLRGMKTLRRAPDDNFLKTIPSSEIPGLVSGGLLTIEEAQRWYRLNPSP